MIGYYGGTDMLYLIALFAILIISFWAQARVQTVFKRYANTRVSSGMSADHIAQALLAKQGYSTQITPVEGNLTDHYNPKTGIVGLSTQVYGSDSISAVAVAAHEIGHVVQYHEGYGPIRFRNAVLPVAAIGSQAAPWIVLLGVFMGSFNFAMIGVILFGVMLLFQLVTLPVEFNASNRALRMLEEGNYISYEESDQAKKVLRAAAMTYVLAALSALISFLRLLSIARRTKR